jgi:hypothetical protein
VNTSTTNLAIGAAVWLATMSAVHAHHSVSAWFNQDEIVELEGEVTEVLWQNPHVTFFMRAPGQDGQVSRWEIETLSVSGISRWGIKPDLLSVGDRVRVAGNPSRRGRDNIFVRNVLLPSGQELVFGGEARWSDDALRGSEVLRASEGVASDPSRGIFRVWSTGSGTSMIFPENIDRTYDLNRYPLTAAARAAVDAFDQFADDPTNDCVPKGMPLVMEQPYPMEFVEQAGGVILLRLEEYDTLRTIHMGEAGAAGAARQAPNPLGYSVGRWDGRNLIVTTTRINSGTFDSVGIPLSEQAEIVERFAPTEDGARLDYAMTVTDPVNFTRPVEVGKHFIHLPDVVVEPYECRGAASD